MRRVKKALGDQTRDELLQTARFFRDKVSQWEAFDRHREQEHKEQVAESEARILQVEQYLLKAEAEVAKLEATLAQRDDEVIDAWDMLGDMSASIAEKDSARIILEEQLKRLSREADNLTSSNQQLISENQKLVSENERLKAQVLALKPAKQQLQQDMEQEVNRVPAYGTEAHMRLFANLSRTSEEPTGTKASKGKLGTSSAVVSKRLV